jgi:hypothetical protein
MTEGPVQLCQHMQSESCGCYCNGASRSDENIKKTHIHLLGTVSGDPAIIRYTCTVH